MTRGYVYTYDYQTVQRLRSDGSFVFSKSGDELNGQFCQLSESEVGITASSADGKMVFRQLDPETKDWGRGAPISSRAWNIFPGNDVYTYFFTNNGSIFGERKDTGAVEKVVDWLACDVDSNTINNGSFGVAFRRAHRRRDLRGFGRRSLAAGPRCPEPGGRRQHPERRPS